MNLSHIVKYYKNCYQEDNQGTQIMDVFSKSIQGRYFFEGKDELINGFLPYYAIADKYAQETLKKVTVSEKEKELVYCSIFIAGKSDNLRFGNSRICSPLFIFPAEIVKIEEDYFVKIDHEQRRINYSIFNDIFTDNKIIPDFIEELYQIVGNNKIDLTVLSLISKLFEKYTSNIDTNELLIFPEIVNKSKLQGVFRKKAVSQEGKFIMLPASALAIIKKSINTRGIINELNSMSENEIFSTPLKAVFENYEYSPSKAQDIGYIPAILSREQEQIVKTSSKYPFTVIIGPPGTGKSYTISALAIEKMSKGNSVLIASGTDKAVDIIAEKIENQLGLKNIIVRAGRREYRKKMISYVKYVLKMLPNESDTLKSSVLSKKLRIVDKRILKLNRTFAKQIKQEMLWGKFYAEKKESLNFFEKIREKHIKNRNKNQQKPWNIEEQMQESFSERNKLIKTFIDISYRERLKSTLIKDRQTISNLLKALKSLIGSKQEQYFQNLNYDTVFKVFPVWLVKMSDVYKVLPLFKEMFDYVIIDEATQSNIAQALPIFQRGKKVVVTGDPKQLRHFSFLSKAKQNIFIDKLELNDVDEYLTDYRNNSLLDVVSQSTKYGEQFTSLYEHFRSLPSLIKFSNENFYDNKLKIMTSKPGMSQNLGIKIVNCKGERVKQGYNAKEADAIISTLKEIIENEKDIKKNICSSIGILSPFRNQVEYLAKHITRNFSIEEIEKHSISINTAYGFQGDERDIMMLSFVVDNNTNATAYRYMNKSNVFNVSITRGRKMQYIFHSVDSKTMKTDSFLRKYLESFELNKSVVKKDEINDGFLKDVKSELEKRDFQTWENFKIAGLNIDLIVKKNGKIVGIDLIGFPGEFVGAFSVDRYKMLNRAGVDMFPLPYTYWIDNKEFCLQEIQKTVV